MTLADGRPGEHWATNARCTLERSGDLGAPREGLRAMPANSIGQKTDGAAGDRVRHMSDTTNYENTAGYGEDAVWPNVFWTIIGIISAGALAVFLLVQ